MQQRGEQPKVLGNAAMSLTVEIMAAVGGGQKSRNQPSAADCSFCACTTSAALRASTSLAEGIQPAIYMQPADLCL